ncbi:MAG: hypothetical protein ACLSFZ_06980 [Frisingicoccus sp.]
MLAFTMVLSLSVTVFAEDDSKSDDENDVLESCELTEGCILPGGHEGVANWFRQRKLSRKKRKNRQMRKNRQNWKNCRSESIIFHQLKR